MQTSRQTFPMQKRFFLGKEQLGSAYLDGCHSARHYFSLWISRDIISHKNWHFYCGVHFTHIIKCRRSFYRCHDRDILLLLQNLQSCKENTKNRGAHFKENRVCSSNDSRGSNTTDVKVSKTCFSVPFFIL